MQLVWTCPSKLILWWTPPRSLCAQELAGVPPQLAGVYALMAFTPMRPRFVVYYIGQSADIARRLDDHTASPKPFLFGVYRHLPTYFAAARVEHPVIRTSAEGALIRALAPVGNDSIPVSGIGPITVTLPPTNILPFPH